ncbi:MAG: RDD family protein [Candidatus Riflebacteria bacterium]
MEADRFNVELQGVTPDLMQANGSHESIEFKNLGTQRIAEMLQILAQLCPPPGDDVCPVNMMVHGSHGDFTFTVFDDSGQIYCADPEGAVSVDQAIEIIAGRPAEFPFPPDKSSKTGSCPNCSAEIIVGKAFCSDCGQPIPSSGITTGDCPKCGGKNDPGKSFCGDCGQPLGAPPAGPKTTRPAAPQKQAATPAAPPSRPQPVKKEATDSKFYHEIVALMGNPLSLREYREKYPYLLKGPKGPEYREVIDGIFRSNPPAEVHSRLTMPPRDWGIRKPGKFRRALTSIIDFPMLLVLIVAGVRLGEMLKLDPDGLLTGILALSWIFLIAPVGFYTLFETTLGATPGGLLMGLRVVDDYGNKPGASVSIWRIIAKVTWLFILVMSIITLSYRVNRLPGHMIQLPSGESLKPIDHGEVVVN